MRLKVLINDEVARDTYRLEIERPAGWSAEAGQFVMVRVNDFNYPLLRRPFSISGGSCDCISIMYRVVGEGTLMLSKRKPGEYLDVVGPLGNFFEIKSTKKILVVGGGIGAAPLLFLVERLNNYRLDYMSFFGFNSADEMFAEGSVISTMDGSTGVKGDIVTVVSKELDDNVVVYACGPIPMLRTLSYLCLEAGAEMQVSVESRMACGIGVCLGCAIDTVNGKKRVCADGPVFNHEEIIWEKMLV